MVQLIKVQFVYWYVVQIDVNRKINSKQYIIYRHENVDKGWTNTYKDHQKHVTIEWTRKYVLMCIISKCMKLLLVSIIKLEGPMSIKKDILCSTSILTLFVSVVRSFRYAIFFLLSFSSHPLLLQSSLCSPKQHGCKQ